MNKIIIKVDDRMTFSEHSFFNFLEERYNLDEGGFVFTDDLRDDFNDYMNFKNCFSVRYVALMLMKILPRLHRTSKEIIINNHERKRKRGFKGLSKIKINN